MRISAIFFELSIVLIILCIYLFKGLLSIHYTYQANTNLVKNINVVEPGFELKHEIRYHLGMIKDERYLFSAKCGLHNTHLK